MAHRVILWGTGFVGKMGIEELLAVHDPAKQGRDVGRGNMHPGPARG